MISPNVLEAEELVGHEFNDDEDHLIAVARDGRASAPREAIMTAPDGCFALMLPRSRARHRGLPGRIRAGSIEPRATVGSGDAFLAGFVAARYAGRAPVDASRTASPAAPSPRSTSAPASSTPSRSAACSVGDRGRSGPRCPRQLGRRFPGLDELAGATASMDRSPFRPPRNLGSRHGSRDRSRQEGASRLRVRRHRDRPVAAGRATPTTSTSPGRSAPTASSSRCSPRRWTASSRPATAGIIGKPRRPRRPEPRGHLHPLRGRRRAARADRRASPARRRRARCRRSTRSRSSRS